MCTANEAHMAYVKAPIWRFIAVDRTFITFEDNKKNVPMIEHIKWHFTYNIFAYLHSQWWQMIRRPRKDDMPFPFVAVYGDSLLVSGGTWS